MKRGTPDHPKMAALADRLGVTLPTAVGMMELLWHFTARFAPQGNIGKWTDVAIAEAAHWAEQPAQLVRTLVELGWLDECAEHRLIVHDWADHCDDSTKKMLQRKGLRPVTLSGQRRKMSGQRRTKLDCQAENGGLPKPSHSHSQTKPVDSPNGESCGETDKPSSPPALPPFPCDGKQPEWTLTQAKLAEYQTSYPSLDVLAECRAARQWCIDNPSRRKTHGGMPTFLTNWLNRAQNRNRGTPAVAAGRSAIPDLPGFHDA